jgi:hypothetical protein
VLELGPEIQKSLTQARGIIERVQNKLDTAISLDKPLTTEKEVAEYVRANGEKWLTGGMDNNLFGGPGQRGNPNSKLWLLGQEGYVDDKYNPGTNKQNADPVTLVNSLRLHNKLYDLARKEAGNKIDVGAGVQNYLQGKPFSLDKWATVERWLEDSPTIYTGRISRMAQSLGYSGDLLGANISSFMQNGHTGFKKLSELLKRNGVDTDTFANGAFKSQDNFYRASVNARLPIMLKGIKKYKPEIVYVGQQSAPDKKSFSNVLLYKLSQKTGLPVQHINYRGFDYKYVVIPLPGGKQTVVINAWHPTGLKGAKVAGEGGAKAQVDFATNLLKVLRTGGQLPEGVTASQVDKATMDKVLAEGRKVTSNAPKAKMQSQVKAKPGGSSGMADWSVLKLQKAYERAYDAEDKAMMAQIAQVLKNKGALVK